MSGREPTETQDFLVNQVGLPDGVARDLTPFLLGSTIFDQKIRGEHMVFGMKLGEDTPWFKFIEKTWAIAVLNNAPYIDFVIDAFQQSHALGVRRTLRLTYLIAHCKDTPTESIIRMTQTTIPLNLLSVWRPITVDKPPGQYLGFLAFVDTTEKLVFHTNPSSETVEPPTYFNKSINQIMLIKLFECMDNLGFDLVYNPTDFKNVWLDHDRDSRQAVCAMLNPSGNTVPAPKWNKGTDPGKFMRDVLHVAVVLQIMYELSVVGLVDALADMPSIKKIHVRYATDHMTTMVSPWFTEVRVDQ